jgi:hypothetical protein
MIKIIKSARTIHYYYYYNSIQSEGEEMMERVLNL